MCVLHLIIPRAHACPNSRFLAILFVLNTGVLPTLEDFLWSAVGLHIDIHCLSLPQRGHTCVEPPSLVAARPLHSGPSWVHTQSVMNLHEPSLLEGHYERLSPSELLQRKSDEIYGIRLCLLFGLRQLFVQQCAHWITLCGFPVA